MTQNTTQLHSALGKVQFIVDGEECAVDTTMDTSAVETTGELCHTLLQLSVVFWSYTR